MSKFTAKLKSWFQNRPTKRRLIQIYTALLYNANIKGYIKGSIFKGESKYACVPGLNCYSCPGAVAACPLGALQNAFASSGNSSAYYVFGILALFGVILGRTICGFFCPVGLAQELLYKIPTPKLAKSRATRILSYLKYVILVLMVVAIPLMYATQGIAVPAFCKYICPAGTFGGGLGLLLNPVNWEGSTNLLQMLGPIFTWKFALMIVIIIACIFLYRPFCRFLCPLGAIYGFFNKFALFGIKVNEDKCTHCGLCVQHCKMDVKHVGDHECINCGECKGVCPTNAISWKCGKLFGEKDGDAVALPEPQTDTTVIQEKSVACTASCATCTIACATATASSATTVGGATVFADAAPSASASIVKTSGGTSDNGNKPRTKHGKAFWIQLVAWTLALLLLVGVVLYSNVFADSNSLLVNEGELAPDFDLKMYGKEGNSYKLLDTTFKLSDHLGEVTVVNFWATWCGPCVAEIPEFNRVAEDYPEVNVIGVHGSSTENVAKFIRDKGWTNYAMTFVQDELDGTDCLTFNAYGGRDTWPMTLIVGKDGKVTCVRNGSFPEDQLRAEVEKALA